MAGPTPWPGITRAVLLAVGCAAPTAAAEPALIIHVDDRAGVPTRELAAAKVVVERTFRATGVEIGWTVGRFPVSLRGPSADFPQARHVAVMLVNSTDKSTRGAVGCALGFAAPRHSLAYAFYNRIVAAWRSRAVDLAAVLGRVMAHEVGHLMLPSHGHSSYGIMRADLDLEFSNPDRFTDDQAQAIRERLISEPGGQ